MQKSIIPTKWPFVGMIPAALVNVHRLHEYATEVLACSSGTFLFKSFPFSNMDMLFTANPLDIHHILSKNFPNYPKGQKFRKLFDIFGDGIFSTDGDLWEFHRKTITSLFEHRCFPSLLENTFWNKVEVGLLPVLEDVSRQGVELDLQDIFQRFTFDTICKLLFDYDPQSMSPDSPDIPCEKALSGNEKKLSDAWETLDQFIYKCLDPNQNKYSNRKIEDPEEKFCLLTSLMREFKDYSGTSGNPKKFMRDTFLNLMAAGRDSTSSALSWFFYLLAKNPIVEDKIIQEIQTQLEMKIGEKWKRFHEKELGKLVYLQGALFEA
nr:alkane hydroxylase MAH1-like [Tanacetum cinerariifolium]